jgi:hypothetical protein
MRKKLKVVFFFAWFDFWVGFYYDRGKEILYFCPLPMCVFSFRWESKKPVSRWRDFPIGLFGPEGSFYLQTPKLADKIKNVKYEKEK